MDFIQSARSLAQQVPGYASSFASTTTTYATQAGNWIGKHSVSVASLSADFAKTAGAATFDTLQKTAVVVKELLTQLVAAIAQGVKVATPYVKVAASTMISLARTHARDLQLVGGAVVITLALSYLFSDRSKAANA